MMDIISKLVQAIRVKSTTPVFWRKSLDIDSDYQNMCSSTRQNALLIEDTKQTDHPSLLKSFLQVTDYFFNDYIFKILTIEHDAYRWEDKYRHAERSFLSSLGYYLLYFED
jgi:hypothetical protein